MLDQPENQPHRGDLAKMLVHRRARRRGVGARCSCARPSAAHAPTGKTLLVLDTVSDGDAERLYARLGWQPLSAGSRLRADARWAPCATTFFYRRLDA